MLGVRWATPASLTVFQAAGAQATLAVVVARLAMLPLTAWYVGALSDASARIVRLAAPALTSSVRNCTYALVIVAPAGIWMPVKRVPTICWVLPSVVSSRSELSRAV